MSLSTAGLQNLGDHLASIGTHCSLHTAQPSNTGSLATTAARQPAAWSATTTGGLLSLSAAETFTGGAASGPVTWVGIWTALTAGTFLGAFQITTGDLTFNAAGEYVLDDMNITLA